MVPKGLLIPTPGFASAVAMGLDAHSEANGMGAARGMAMRDQVVVVTGAGSGIGQAAARRFAREGARVVVNYRQNRVGADATVEACIAAGGQALAHQGDVCDDTEARALAGAALAAWGRIDALVNSAGVTVPARHDDLEALSGADFHAVYDVNVVGSYQMIRAVAPAMKAQGRGAIVNVSSAAGVDGSGSSVAYAASKGALNTMTLSLARALAPEIRVNAVCPGVLDTGFLRGRLPDQAIDDIIAGVRAEAPLRRVGTVDDIAETIYWLIAGDPNLTGQTVVSDGGMRLKGWSLR